MVAGWPVRIPKLAENREGAMTASRDRIGEFVSSKIPFRDFTYDRIPILTTYYPDWPCPRQNGFPTMGI